MLAEERRSRIVRALDASGTLGTEQLAEQLDVSPETIRRDLVQLERQGAVRRVHGGATRHNSTRGVEPEYLERLSSGAEAKRAIGARAAELVASGQTLVLDVGTTALAVAQALPPHFRGTVVTCSLLVAVELAGRPDVDVLIAGGRVRGGDLAISNAQTVAYLQDVHADIAFLGSGGIASKTGVTDFHLDEIASRRVMIANARESYVLADSGKFGQVAAYRACGFAEITGVISDRQPPAELRRTLVKAGARLLVPEPSRAGNSRRPS